MTKKIFTGLNILSIIIFIFFLNYPVNAEESLIDKSSLIEYQKENEVLAGQIQQMVKPVKEHIYREIGLNFEKIINIKICLNTVTFKKTTGINNLSVQGIAISELNLIILNSENIFSKGKSDIEHLLEHEIAHLVLGNYISHFSGNHLPRWFNEGLAQWISEGANELFSASYQNSLQSAFLNKNLIPFSSLTFNFPNDQSDFILAYAQSLSFIEYIAEQYGDKNLKTLIRLLITEKDFSKAFNKIYKLPVDEVEKNWINTKKNTTYTIDYYFATHINTIIDSLVGIVAVIVFILIYFRNKIKKKRIEDSQDIIDS